MEAGLQESRVRTVLIKSSELGMDENALGGSTSAYDVRLLISSLILEANS